MSIELYNKIFGYLLFLGMPTIAIIATIVTILHIKKHNAKVDKERQEEAFYNAIKRIENEKTTSYQKEEEKVQK